MSNLLSIKSGIRNSLRFIRRTAGGSITTLVNRFGGGQPKTKVVRAEDLKEQLTETGKPVCALRGARILGKLDLKHHTIKVAVDIQDCEFMNEVDLRYCEFKQTVDFSNSMFRKHFDSGSKGESRTIYRKDLICRETVFEGPVDLNGSLIEGSSLFSNAKFQDTERSIDQSWSSVGLTLGFDDALLVGKASFCNLKCSGNGTFNKAEFCGEADFAEANLSGTLDCTGTTFKDKVSFESITCGIAAMFDPATFLGEANFRYASLGKNLQCMGSTFEDRANFKSIKCGSNAFFNGTYFKRRVDFDDATFDQNLLCQNATFGARAGFIGIKCGVNASFGQATFLDEATFAFASITRDLNCMDATFYGYVELYQCNVGSLVIGDKTPFGENSQVDLRESQFDRFFGSPTMARELVERQPPEAFSRDPYLQLEKYYRGVGNELEANRFHFRGRSELSKNAWRKGNRTAEWPLFTKLGDASLWLLTGYGVRTWQLLIPIFLFLIIGTYVFWPSDALVLPPGTQGATNEGQVSEAYVISSGPGQEQSQGEQGQHLFDRASYSLDLFLPVVNLHIDEHWQPQGLGRQIYAIFHTMVGWILVPLLLASLTGIIRRE